ncbi:hypothetical protein TWF696_008989 [Orbilia brochopaga]|uniref:Uncharacterized protein n=1 Tax=Orbilia brochopaga TaxID=3140254 RepID=A0AAV9UHI8_9PEZI
MEERYARALREGGGEEDIGPLQPEMVLNETFDRGAGYSRSEWLGMIITPRPRLPQSYAPTYHFHDQDEEDTNREDWRVMYPHVPESTLRRWFPHLYSESSSSASSSDESESESGGELQDEETRGGTYPQSSPYGAGELSPVSYTPSATSSAEEEVVYSTSPVPFFN